MNVYLGTFLIAFSTLAFEITLSRFLSVSAWYHLAFFAISTAMLGMTAGATTVFLKKDWIERRNLNDAVALACLGYTIFLPIALILLCLVPMKVEKSLMAVVSLLTVTVLCTLPFYFSGVALSMILTKYDLPIGKLYAIDLIGASLGCLFVLAGLERFSAPDIILLCALVGGIATFVFAWQSKTFLYRKALLGVCIGLVALVGFNAATGLGIYPLAAKGKVISIRDLVFEKWNSFSRVVVYKGVEEEPYYWGPSPKAPTGIKTLQYLMNIDGDASTTLSQYKSPADMEVLRYDITNVGYFLRPSGGACVIGVGAGRDIQSALLFGHENVLGLDVNPTFINLQKNQFRDVTNLGNNPKVRFVTDEARSYLTHTDEKFTILQMSMIDTWAATGAGAFSLSENGLYTVEAWNVFFNRLNDDGIFTVSRWSNPENVSEVGRLLSITVTSLLQNGVKDPSQHVAIVMVDKVSTLLVSKQPFKPSDIATLQKVSADMEYKVIMAPGLEAENPFLRGILSSKSPQELHEVIKDAPLNYEAATDESPYFFNMLKLSNLGYAFKSEAGVLSGNVGATITLVGLIICLGLLALITVIVPLRIGTKTHKADPVARKAMLVGASYFCLIGAGFMFAEIAMIQKLSVFLGHPVYALGILLFTVIASTGIGSFLSDRIPLTRTPFNIIFPVLTALAIVAQKFVLSIMVSNMIAEPITTKALACVAAIFPLGILLGFFFPTGMKFFKPLVADDTPWFWALNGIFGVLSSALAVFISIYFGISFNFFIAAGCYILIALPIRWASRVKIPETSPDDEVIPYKRTEPVAV